MCLICVEFDKNSLTVEEAWRNLRELKSDITDEHYDEVRSMLLEKLESEIEDEEQLELLLEKLEQDDEQLSFNFDEKEPEEDYYDDDWTAGNDYY